MIYKKPMKRTFRKKPHVTLQALAKQVKSLQKKTKLVTSDVVYRQSEGIDVISPYAVRNLTNYNTWTAMFPTGSGANNTEPARSRGYVKTMLIDNLVTLDNVNNEEGTINFTYMIISRKDSAGTAVDTVNALSLASAVDYTNIDGKAFMNLKKFKIHYSRRFTLTMADTPDADASVMQKRFTAKIKINKIVENPDGAWYNLENSPDPSDTYYAILFSDNSTADLENPRWQFTSIVTVNS